MISIINATLFFTKHRLLFGRIAKCGRLLCLLFVFALLISVAPCVYAVPSEEIINRYNVAIIVDASQSMETSDPTNLRFEAISQFVNLLAEQGNYVGSVVFSTRIRQQREISLLDSQGKKESLLNEIQGISPGGYTNIGAALSEAVRMLDSGDPNLPSAILILSDGYTDMPTQDEIDISLEEKADAIQLAREKGIPIYSVCLNSGDEVDVAEMRQLADATNGVFREVKTADDLTEVFNTFYSMIYGTASITLVDDVFPDNGVLETTFEVPGIGVEEINILVYGNALSQTLIRPDGRESSAVVVDSKTYSLIKESQVMPGKWILRTEGIPGDQIRVNMVYNTNLSVSVSTAPDSPYINQLDPIVVSAFLSAGAEKATRPEQFIGYTAELVTTDAYQDEIGTIPMQVSGDHFEAKHQFPEGTYYYYVRVKGNYIEKQSALLGPLTVDAAIPTQEEQEQEPELAEKIVLPENHAPKPVVDPVEYTVNIWPFKENVLEFDLSGLAQDPDGDNLRYRIVSTSFMEGTDFTVSGDKVRMNHYSLKKGAYTVKVTDPGGLSCEIEVVVRSHNIGRMTLIGLGIAAIIAAGILGVLLYLALTRPFLGTITCSAGIGQGTQIKARRGRLKLSVFRLPEPWKDYPGYFQATGKNYIFLKTKRNSPVFSGDRSTGNLRIDSGHPVTVKVSSDSPKTLTIKFDSIIRTRRRAGSTGAGGSRYANRSQAKTPPRKF